MAFTATGGPILCFGAPSVVSHFSPCDVVGNESGTRKGDGKAPADAPFHVVYVVQCRMSGHDRRRGLV